MNAEFDASNGLLYTFSKGRGLGDCGVATRWQFNGSEFVTAGVLAAAVHLDHLPE